jgi:hypothetical protein
MDKKDPLMDPDIIRLLLIALLLEFLAIYVVVLNSYY